MTLRPPQLGPRSWVLIVALALLGLELGLGRWGGYGQHIPTWPDARLGWRKAPERSVRGPNGNRVRTNSLGYRDREWAAPAEASLSVGEGGREGLRVAVLGDSVHFGPGLGEEQLWPRQLERALHEVGPGREVLVMNFAVVGYVFEQMARVWEDQVRAWSPDIVILGVNTWVARPMRYLSRPSRGPFARRVEGTAIYDWLQHLAGAGSQQWPVRWEAPPEEDRRSPREIEVSMRRTPLARENEALWRALLERLEGMNQEVEARGGRLVLVSVPRLEQVRGDLSRWSGSRWDELATRVGVVHIDLLPDFREAMSEVLAQAEAAGGFERFWSAHAAGDARAELEDADSSLYLFGEPEHLTARGQALIARRVQEALASLGLAAP